MIFFPLTKNQKKNNLCKNFTFMSSSKKKSLVLLKKPSYNFYFFKYLQINDVAFLQIFLNHNFENILRPDSTREWQLTYECKYGDLHCDAQNKTVFTKLTKKILLSGIQLFTFVWPPKLPLTFFLYFLNHFSLAIRHNKKKEYSS